MGETKSDSSIESERLKIEIVKIHQPTMTKLKFKMGN
jgi:hypothetical protein